MKDVVFCVTNNNQNRTAISIGRKLENLGVKYQFLDLQNLKVVENVPTFSKHTPSLTLLRVVKAVNVVSKLSDSIVVLGQDVGLIERIISTGSRRRGAKTVIIPDGVVHSSLPKGNKTNLLKDIIFQLLQLLGLITGNRQLWYESSPTEIFLWGTGWLQHQLQNSKQLVIGAPRFDRLFQLRNDSKRAEPRILICSTDLESVGAAESSVKIWYECLDQIGKFASVRIRLHPNEKKKLEQSQKDRFRSTNENSFEKDLNWATHVVSPFSTTLVEAIAAGRNPVMVQIDPCVNEFVRHIPIFRQGFIPKIEIDIHDTEKELFSKILDASFNVEIAESFLANIGNASTVAADRLSRLAFGKP